MLHRSFLSAFVLLLGLSAPQPVFAAENLVCDWLVDNFQGSPVGAFPKGWRTKEADEMPFATSNNIYVVEKQGNRKVLHAVFKDKAVTIGKTIKGWDLDKYPVMEWQWKAVTLPTGGNEDSLSSNDCAASVYTFWDIGFPFYVDSLKYSWSSTLPVGTEIKKRLGHDFVRVLESGPTSLSKWKTVRVNLRNDHKRLFGKDKRSPSGIAILTDADATKSVAEAYYANFRLCRPAK